MLKIQLDDIKEKGLLLEGEVSPDAFPQLEELAEEGEATFPEPIRYRLHLTRLADLIEVDGQIDSVVVLSCGRCLESYRMPVASRFFLAYARQLPEYSDEDGDENGTELSADEMGLMLVEGEEITLDDPLQEQILMALPIQPLCHGNCKGLCPICGVNLNEASCDCVAPRFDTRFAALKDFKAGKKK